VRGRIEPITLGRRDLKLIRGALRRGIDWSDYWDNRKALGADWARQERSFIRRSEALLQRLNTWLAISSAKR